MILVGFGTRPELIKLKPLISYLKDNGILHILVCVGQHKDLVEDVRFDFEYHRYIHIPVKENQNLSRIQNIIKSIISCDKIPEGWENEHIMVVQGDTATAYGLSLLAYSRSIPVYHVEAGMRSFDLDNPNPEEAFRKMISSMASLHFCPTLRERNNLLRYEKIPEHKIRVTGNTSIDNLVGLEPEDGNEVLITLHRRENRYKIPDYLKEIKTLKRKYPKYKFTYIGHPSVDSSGWTARTLRPIHPLPYSEMLERVRKCKLVITASGGLQEECNFFRKNCIVCRVVTERPCDTNIMAKEPKDLGSAFEAALVDPPEGKCIFGDGDAAERIAKELFRRVQQASEQA